ncbi:MAG: SurA N-terminal domain-containing protein [Microlunatus sp.]|nr:SurA N-terminal domain-containing protein [Microlunatus sp.]MDN5805186.1 SurA N-terminal domain-containing protein [Microlunatus sp.]
MRRRWSAAVLLMLLLALFASGCAAGGSPSTVAYVGDTQITQRQLDDALSGVQSTLGPDQQVSPSAVVSVLIHGVIAQQIAAEQGVTVTDAQRNALVNGSNLAPLLSVPAAKTVAYDIADQQLVARQVGPEVYLKGVQDIPVELNPRFGVLDPAQKTIIDGQSSSLSVPAST